MNKKQHIQNTIVLSTAIAAAIATLYANTQWFGKKVTTVPTERERCYGIVRSGKNDCATSKHACASKANSDRDPEEWVMVPKGLCARIIGSSNE